MAEIHPEIQTLLEGLLQSDLAPLAVASITRIEQDDMEPGTGIEDLLDQPERQRVHRQAEHVHQAIVIPLKREVEMMHRIRVLAEQFDLKSVVVLPPGRGGGGDVAARPDELLSHEREAAIRELLDVLMTALSDVRTRWEAGRDVD